MPGLRLPQPPRVGARIPIAPKVWTGREVRLLRLARRMSVRWFAAHLGVSDRMVSKWEAGGHLIRPRPVNQAALDTSLERAGAAAQQRFLLALSESGLAAPPIQVPDAARQIVRHPVDGKLMTMIETGSYCSADGPAEEVTAFFIDVQPVTNKEYLQFLMSTGHQSPAARRNDDLAVTGIDWDDVRAYARWATKEPAEASQWLRASEGREGMATAHVAEWCHAQGRPLECGPARPAARGFRCTSPAEAVLGMLMNRIVSPPPTPHR